MLTDLSVKNFLNKTAGNDPVPGGGSISALNGAIAAALGEMVTRLTIGRKKYADREAEMTTLLAEIEPVRNELETDIDRDSDAYNLVFDAFKLPKDTDEEKSTRSAAIQSATRYAAEVPMQVARRVISIMSKLEVIARTGNQNAVTDACVATMCARTAVLGALMNVRINLSSIKDEDYVKTMALEASSLHDQAVAIEKRVLDYLNENLQ